MPARRDGQSKLVVALREMTKLTAFERRFEPQESVAFCRSLPARDFFSLSLLGFRPRRRLKRSKGAPTFAARHKFTNLLLRLRSARCVCVLLKLAYVVAAKPSIE